jgi:dsRNA-specific ribonuclease
VIERVYAAEFAHLDPATLGKDPKTRLQEWLQARIRGAGLRGDATTVKRTRRPSRSNAGSLHWPS